jgi:hypothetical protein
VSLFLTLALSAVSAPASAQQDEIDFGDDSSQWANDGECDDPRFEGEGTAATLLDEDRGHDAADCRALFAAGRVRLRTALPSKATTFDGRLAKGDGTLTTGEYFDAYELEGEPGQYVVIDLRSAAFDTYLILMHPSGEQTENDDAEDDDVGHSRIELDLTEAGTYHVFATSYEKGETGPYSLTIEISEGAGRANLGSFQASVRPAAAHTP